MFKIKYGKHLATIVLCVVCLLSLNINTFAAGPLTFTIRDFSLSGSGSDDLPATFAYTTESYQDRELLYIYATNSGFYGEGNIKMIMGVKLLNLDYNTNYNLKFDYRMNSEVSYSLLGWVDNNDNASDGGLTLHNSEYNYQSGGRMDYHSCNVNFSLNGSGLVNQTDYYFYLMLLVPKGFAYNNWKFGFSNFVLTDLDDYGSFTPPSDVEAPTSNFSQSSDELDVVAADLAEIEELYKIDSEELDRLLHLDMNDYDNGLTVVKTVVEDILDASQLLPVLTFVLAWGLAIYIIGRRLA